jgi:nitric oxide reductase subunit B
MWWRELCGVLMLVGFVILVWDLLTVGKRETRIAEALEPA